MDNSFTNITIQEVASLLGIELISSKMARCFNKSYHKNGDAHPSLSFINEQYFKCFACGIKGNLFELIKIFKNFDYTQSLEWLRTNFSSEMPHRKINEKSNSEKIDYSTKTQILTDFINICGAPSLGARNYFSKRKLSEGIVSWFQLTDIKDDTIKKIKQKYTYDILEAAGLFYKDKFVFAKYNLLIPYGHNEKIYFIKARAFGDEQKPKYIGLRSKIDFPYNIDILLHPDITREHVFICEGEIDCLTLLDHQLNAIAIPGINGFKEAWIKVLMKYEIIPVIAFDNDESGKTGAANLQKLFSKHCIKSKVIYPQKKDWNSEEWTLKN